MGCVESMNYEIVLRDATFKESRDYIRSNFKESIDVQPGFKIFDVHVIGLPPDCDRAGRGFCHLPVYQTLSRHLPAPGGGQGRGNKAAGFEEITKDPFSCRTRG